MDKRELSLEDFLALQSEEELEHSCLFFQVDLEGEWTEKRMAEALAEEFRTDTDKLFEVLPWEGLHFLSEIFRRDCIMADGPVETPHVAENEADFIDAMERMERIGLIHSDVDPDTGNPLTITVPFALREIMAPLLTTEQMEYSKILDMIASLVRGMLYYYGAVEMGRLLRMLHVILPGFPEDTFEILLNVRANLRPYVRVEIVHEKVYVFGETEFGLFLDEEREMEEMVGTVEAAHDLAYKTFSPVQLFQASQEGYLENRDGYERLKSKLKAYFTFKPLGFLEDSGLPGVGEDQMKELELDLLLRAMTASIRRSGDVAYALSEMERVTDFPSEKERKEVHDEFIFYTDNLSRFAFKGHTPNEMRNLRSGDQGKVLPFRKTRKIGRNDPCPCGSGKKYKNCHGKVQDPSD